MLFQKKAMSVEHEHVCRTRTSQSNAAQVMRRAAWRRGGAAVSNTNKVTAQAFTVANVPTSRRHNVMTDATTSRRHEKHVYKCI